MSNIQEQYEKIEIGGKAYMKSSVNSGALIEELKKQPGSFINILANRMSLSEAPGRVVSYWR